MCQLNINGDVAICNSRERKRCITWRIYTRKEERILFLNWKIVVKLRMSLNDSFRDVTKNQVS